MPEGGAGTVVVGTRAWGVAPATAVAASGRLVSLLCHSATEADSLDRDRVSPRHPSLPLPGALRPTADRAIVRDADVVVMVVPARS
jgi:glycerol-3-phosphate dehydrogenase